MTKNAKARAIRVCGCGTCGEAIEAAARIVRTEKDCYHWNQTVDHLVRVIRANVMLQALLAKGVDLESASATVGIVDVSQYTRAREIAEDNGAELWEICEKMFQEKKEEGDESRLH